MDGLSSHLLITPDAFLTKHAPLCSLLGHKACFLFLLIVSGELTSQFFSFFFPSESTGWGRSSEKKVKKTMPAFSVVKREVEEKVINYYIHIHTHTLIVLSHHYIKCIKIRYSIW